jgi:hypothetical protein
MDSVLTLNREMTRLFDRLARDGFDLAYPTYAYGAETPAAVWPKVEIYEAKHRLQGQRRTARRRRRGR